MIKREADDENISIKELIDEMDDYEMEYLLSLFE